MLQLIEFAWGLHDVEWCDKTVLFSRWREGLKLCGGNCAELNMFPLWTSSRSEIILDNIRVKLNLLKTNNSHKMIDLSWKEMRKILALDIVSRNRFLHCLCNRMENYPHSILNSTLLSIPRPAFV